VEGGSGSYTFTWSTGQTNQNLTGLQAGSYSVTITDINSCTLIAEIEINEPDELILSTIATHPECFGSADGQVNVQVTGGTSPYLYLWDDGNGQTTATAGNLAAGNYAVIVTDGNNCTASANAELTDPDPLDITFTTTDALCFGSQDGTATITASGGSGVYTYTWSNGATGSTIQMGAGTYFVTISDQNGCTQTAQADIDQPNEISASTITQTVLCHGDNSGSASVTASGGAGNFTYQWSDAAGQTGNSAQNLPAGAFFVTITDAQGCTVIAEAFVNQPSFALTGTIETSAVSCNFTSDGQAAVVPHGGTMPYSYTWNNSGSGASAISGLAPGNFAVIVTDANGCTLEIQAEVPQPSPISLSLENTKSASCNGASDGIASVIASGGTPGTAPNPAYQYIWGTSPVQYNSQAIQLKGGTVYSVTVTDGNGCSATGSIAINQPDPVQAEVFTIPAKCYGEDSGEATVTNIYGGTTPYSFQWSHAAGGQTGQTASGLFAGQYKVTVSDANGCSKTINANITQPLPVTSVFDLTPVKCKGDSTGIAKISVSGGQEPYQYMWQDSTVLPTGENLSAGSYQVTVTDALGCEQIETFTISEPENELSLLINSADVNCKDGYSGSIQLNGQGGTPNYTYRLNDGDFYAASAFGTLSAGLYTVAVKDANQCAYTDTVVLEDGQSFFISGETQYNILYKHSATLEVEITGEFTLPLQFQWSALGPGYFSCTTCPNPTVTPTDHTDYFVTVTDANGCTATFHLKVLVEKRRTVFVPNAFTPNNDDVNDVLMVHGPYEMIIKVFRVFDRWGNQVFLLTDAPANDPQFGWDGRFRGEQMNSGVFSWQLEVIFSDGYEESFSGHTTLQR